jgi:hypothetical protein
MPIMTITLQQLQDIIHTFVVLGGAVILIVRLYIVTREKPLAREIRELRQEVARLQRIVKRVNDERGN